MAKFFILSCDGGGVRGVVTLTLLQRLCKDVPGLLSRVDLFTGTSTGGIISLGLASGFTPDKILGRYTTLAGAIFRPRYSWAAIALGILVAAIVIGLALGWNGWALALTALIVILALGITALLIELMTAKYAAGPLRLAVAAYFDGNPPLDQLPRQVLVTTFRLNRAGIAGWQPTFFSNLPRTPRGRAFKAEAALHGIATVQEVSVGDAAISTGSAPTYFPSHAFRTPDGAGNFVDGGVYANNPSVVGLAAALSLGHGVDEVAVLSLGTGEFPAYVEGSKSLDWGVWPWMVGRDPISAVAGQISGPPLIDVVTDGPQRAAAFQARQILGAGGYCRLNVPLAKNVPLDAVAAIPELIRQTNAWVDGNPRAWQEAVAWARTVCASGSMAAA